MDITRNRYREVLSALESGAKSSEEIHAEVGFPSIEHCSAALARLSRNHYISRGYVLTEEGRKALHPEPRPTPQTSESPIFPSESSGYTKPIPPRPFKIRVIGGLPQVVRESD